MKFFKKIFDKYNQKKHIDEYNIKSQDLVLKAQKIFNDYGQALMECNEINKRKHKEFMEMLDVDTLKALQSFDEPFQNKFDIRLLPYDKEKIREAIEFLLQYVDETDTTRIGLLETGLLFLDDFIDYSKLGS